MDGYRIQEELFELIKQQLNDPKNWIEQVAEVLSISKPAVYKRINGSTSLSMDDLVVLTRKYNISFDSLVLPSKTTIEFNFPYISSQVKSFIDYTKPLLESVSQLARIPNVQIWYATNELPFFYYFLFDDLTYFKFFMYAKSTWNIPAYADKKIRLSDFDNDYSIKENVKEILKYYNGLPNIEIWNEHILDNTLNQIKFFVSAGLFSLPEEAFVLCDRLSDLLKYVSHMASVGKKVSKDQEPTDASPDFLLYHNEISHTNNILLVSSPYKSIVFSAYDNPNFITSENPDLVEYTLEWFQRVKQSSLPVSKDAQKSRLYLFNQIEKKIDRTRKEIESIISRG